MTLWQQLQNTLEQAETRGLIEHASAGNALLQSVETLSATEGYPLDEMIVVLLDQAVRDRHRMDQAHRGWDALTMRERQVTALVCQGLTGRQVAMRLVLSPETIKTHVRHILRKFNISSRRELRRLLEDWDLNPWLIDERVMD